MAETKYWAPVGRCIYCGISGVPLSGEHGVPEGLGGEHVLPEASCQDCARITSQFEGVCLRGMWPEARAYFGLHGKQTGKQRKAQRPQAFPVAFTGDSGVEHDAVAIEDYPFHMTMPVLPPARGVTPGGKSFDPYPDLTIDDFWVGRAHDAVEKSQRLFRARNKRHKKNVEITFEIPLADFCRLLAKIAHVTAIANAQSRFNTVLHDFILGRPNAPMGTWFVGGAFWADGTRIESISDGKGMHSTLCISHPFEGIRLNYVRIQLFALAGAPVYEVLTGFGELPQVA